MRYMIIVGLAVLALGCTMEANDVSEVSDSGYNIPSPSHPSSNDEFSGIPCKPIYRLVNEGGHVTTAKAGYLCPFFEDGSEGVYIDPIDEVGDLNKDLVGREIVNPMMR